MKEIIIWPAYLDANKSLKEGRKVSKKYAIPDVTLKNIEKAADKLKYIYVLETDKAYPGEWYNKSGRILIDTEYSKKEVLIALCEKIKEREALKESQRNKKSRKNRR